MGSSSLIQSYVHLKANRRISESYLRILKNHLHLADIRIKIDLKELNPLVRWRISARYAPYMRL
jgi:hypothetical protein